jgi:hypothetical protein
MTVSVTPSKMAWARPILGIWISPIWTMGSLARGSFGGAIGWVCGAGAAATAVLDEVGGGRVVVVAPTATRVGASKARSAAVGLERMTATVAAPTRTMAVNVARTRARSARDSGR